MPKREDEYWARTKGRGLCPFCGSSSVYYNKHYRSWKCTKCEKSFPSPSYCSAYYRHMTPEETARAAERTAIAAERQRGKPARIYRGMDDIARGRRSRALPTLGGFTARKAFLIFLLIACILAAIYTGYLLFTHRTDQVVGTIILVADIGVLIWNISVLRKWRVGTGTIVGIAVVIALLGGTIGAFAGIKPFSAVKNGLVAGCQRAPGQPSEQQLPPPSVPEHPSPSPTPAPTPTPKPPPASEDSKELYAVLNEKTSIPLISTKQLRTIAKWSGTEDKVINFSIDRSPWIIQGKYDITSDLGNVFCYIVATKDAYNVCNGCDFGRIPIYMLLYGPETVDYPFPLLQRWADLQTKKQFEDTVNCLVKGSGDFVICVHASGVRWELKVGVE